VKKIPYLILLLFITNISCAGHSKIDSLKELLQNAKQDSNRVNILLSICKLEQNYNTSEALEYGKKALSLAEDIDWNDGIAKANLRLGNTCTVQGNFNKALEYYTKSVDIFRQMGNRTYVEYCQTDMANVYSDLGDYPKALEYYRLSLEESKKLNDTIGIIANLNCIGLVFATLGDFPKALDYYEKARMQAENSGDSHEIAYEIASVSNNIGDLYKRLHDTDRALIFLKKSLRISENINNNKLEATTLLSIGKLFKINNDSATEYVNEALKIYRNMGRDIGVATCMEQLGLVYDKQKKYSLALNFTLNAQELFNKAGEQELLAGDYEQAGIIYEDSLLYEKAEENFRKSYALAKQLGVTEIQRDVLDSLSTLYGKLKQPENELSTYKQYIMLRDTIMNGDKAKAITLKEIEYNDLKNKIEEDNRKAAEERKRNLQLLGIAVFILSFIMLIVLLSRVKIKLIYIKILGVLALLLLFEFISLLIEPLISKWTNDTPLYTLLVLVAVASVLIPTHHRLEHWVKERLTKTHGLKHEVKKTEEVPDKNQPV
jgi:tetratricopeptide (TPR) repeat protein